MNKQILILLGLIVVVVGLISGYILGNENQRDFAAQNFNSSIHPDEKIASGLFSAHTDAPGDAPKCPGECDDNDPCTRDFCNDSTGFRCKYLVITPCCGNEVCEGGENYSSCSIDCKKMNKTGNVTENHVEEETAISNAASKTTECMYVGSESSDKYHLPDCTYAGKIKAENLICFSSKEEAESTGYEPCGACKPSDTIMAECMYVGSIGGAKYHYPNCTHANRINQDNKICFSSKEDAESTGYEPCSVCITSAETSASDTSSAEEPEDTASDTTSDETGCMYVGSENSDKYHLPDCAYAGKIKAENLICFSSKEEAEQQGYVPCGTCKPS